MPQAVSHLLPEYSPPSDQKACVAVGLAPLFVLLAFTLIVVRVMDPDTGFAIFAACTVWVVYEMHDYQTHLDDYNAEYVKRHLAWRSTETLESLISGPDTPLLTRRFVQRFLFCHRLANKDRLRA